VFIVENLVDLLYGQAVIGNLGFIFIIKEKAGYDCCHLTAAHLDDYS